MSKLFLLLAAQHNESNTRGKRSYNCLPLKCLPHISSDLKIEYGSLKCLVYSEMKSLDKTLSFALCKFKLIFPK